MQSRLSILGLYLWDEDIFSGLQVPEEMDREIAITEILSQCAELELVYPSFDVMQTLISSWSKIELPIWKRMYIDSTIEYNPIWNKDGKIVNTEEWDLHHKEGGENVRTIKDDYEDTTTTPQFTTKDANYTKGYNSNAWEESTKTERETPEIETTSSHVTKDNRIVDSPDLDKHDSGTVTTTRIEQGNIGVTKTTELLSDDIDLLPRLNPYQFIVNSFKKRFCLLVY